MQLHARPVAAPPAKKETPARGAERPRPQPAGPQRGAIWHAIQLKAAQRAGAASAASSRSDLPAPLKAGVEALSGVAMDDVRVHRNSAEPAKLGALAYARGNEIHVGPGQERHLPHEAWHVVQQKQGRVRPTEQSRGAEINDDAGLETEADLMGARALTSAGPSAQGAPVQPLAAPVAGSAVMQCKWMQSLGGLLRWDSVLGGMQWYFDEGTDRFHYVVVKDSAVPENWQKIVSEHQGKPLTQDEFLGLGFTTLDVDAEEATVDRGRDRLVDKTKIETSTRIGFEIENSWSFKVERFESYQGYINKTLLTYTDDEYGPILEFILDDPGLESDGAIINYQAEFRTTPLRLEWIGRELQSKVTQAIRNLRPGYLFIKGGEVPKGWTASPDYHRLCGLNFTKRPAGFTMPKSLAQHVTSSINVGAYAELPVEDQKALFASGAGSKDKVELYGKILAAMSAKPDIDATTGGRNKAGAMAKTPIEAMLAAEDAFGLANAGPLLDMVGQEKIPGNARVGMREMYPIGQPTATTRSIVEGGSYPSIQGENEQGFLAIAQKLQPPLIDPGNNELRVLIEHRTDDLRQAVNFILTGRKPQKDNEIEEKHVRIWEAFKAAAGRMDALAKKD